MRSSKVLVLGACLLAGLSLRAQVLLPEEVQAAGPHRLQQKYLSELRAIGSKVETHQFPYNFYFSRALDISEKDQVKADQRSIRFDRFEGYTVLAISGNYFAAYSSDLVNKNGRAKQTLESVILPILQIAVPYFANDDTFDGFAIEVSQHVRRKTVGLASEGAENVMYYFPRAAAQHIIRATTPDSLQGALLESKVYVDAEPFNLWVNGERPSDEPETYKDSDRWLEPAKTAVPAAATVDPAVSQKFIRPAMPARLITPKVVDDLKAEYGTEITRLESDLRDQVHFAGYASTQFIGFHEGAYLQLSLIYEAVTAADASRYKLAALAFDDHVSHLVRGTLAHFQDSTDFDGVLFSVIVKPAHSDGSVAVEYFLPFQPMRCFARYDCTGQELVDAGFVLINGERTSLNLQNAEGTPPAGSARVN